MITEELMRAGSFDIPLRLDSPWSLFDTVLTIDEGVGGHIVITPQWLHPDVVGDVSMIAAARYIGPVLNKEFRDGEFQISGAGMGWWLGDEEGKGDVHEAAVSLSGANLSTAITAALPPGGSITAGTLGFGETTPYTAEHIYQAPLEVIRTIVASMQAEYRVNPDGTLDATINANLFDMTPNVVVARLISGSDPEFKGIPIATARSTRNARRYATRAILVKTEIDGAETLVAAQDQSAASGLDIHGNTIDRTLIRTGLPGVDVGASGFLDTELRDHLVVQEMELTTGFWEVIGGTFSVGDTFWVYDPPALVDTSNQIWFRGDYLHPMELRLVRATWPLVRGMGVWHRDGNAAYTDLTDFVRWDVTDAQAVDTGQSESALRGGRFVGAFGGTTLTVRSFVQGEPGG